MCQRAMIAMALACRPRLLIADEPTTALDVTIQAQILELLRTLRVHGIGAVVFVSHDLGVIAENMDNLVVMYAGEVMEPATVDDCSFRRSTPTRMACSPAALPWNGRGGSLRSPASRRASSRRLPGCPFTPRCPIGSANRRCQTVKPPLMPLRRKPGRLPLRRRKWPLAAPASRVRPRRLSGGAPWSTLAGIRVDFPLGRRCSSAGAGCGRSTASTSTSRKARPWPRRRESARASRPPADSCCASSSPTSGSRRARRKRRARAEGEELRMRARDMQMVFQDPY